MNQKFYEEQDRAHQEQDMKRYVVGFLMDPQHEYGLLIRKSHPDWQKGKLNGVGGKVEYGETDFDAMVREFEEESGILIPHQGWDRFFEITYERAVVVFFRAEASMLVLSEALIGGEEPVQMWHLGNALRYEHMVPNLHYILPMAQHGDEGLRASAVIPR